MLTTCSPEMSSLGQFPKQDSVALSHRGVACDNVAATCAGIGNQSVRGHEALPLHVPCLKAFGVDQSLASLAREERLPRAVELRRGLGVSTFIA